MMSDFLHPPRNPAPDSIRSRHLRSAHRSSPRLDRIPPWLYRPPKAKRVQPQEIDTMKPVAGSQGYRPQGIGGEAAAFLSLESERHVFFILLFFFIFNFLLFIYLFLWVVNATGLLSF